MTDDSQELLSAEERRLLDKQRHEQRLQWVFVFVLGIAMLAFLVPLGVFLTRLAMGG